MAILQVITDTDRRGAQVFGWDLHAALTARGHDVRTVALAPGGRADGLPVDVLGPTRRGRATLRALHGEMSAAEVVVAHGSTTLPASVIAGAGLSTPVVYRQIGDQLYWAGTPGRRLRTRLLLSRTAAVVALWTGAAEVLVRHFGVPPARVSVVPNGVPPQRFPLVGPAERAAVRRSFGLVPDRRTVVYVGALEGQKGVDALVDAVVRLPGRQLLVVGDGGDRDALEAAAARGASGRVVFTGSIAAPAAAYAAADLVVFPSRGADSMPAVLIEAALSGVPVLATRVGAAAEIVADGRSGQLIPAEAVDGPRLAAAIGDLLERGPAEPGEVTRRRCVERYGIEAVAAGWEAVLTRVRAGRASSAA